MNTALIIIGDYVARFAKWFFLAFASWLSKQLFDATVRPWAQSFINWWRRKSSKAAVAVGVEPV